MSDQITTAFVKEFGRTIDLLAQEKGQKFRKAVRMEPITGEFKFFEQIAATSAIRTNTRHADSPLINTEHRRRRVGIINVEWGDLVDDFDKVRLLVDPTNPMSMNAGLAVGREFDDILIEKFFATADTGKEGGTPVVFPSGNQIAADFDGDAVKEGLTVEKMREARKLLKQNFVDLDMEPVWIAWDAEREDDLLGTTEVTSIDFNTVRALVNGDVGSFMGMTPIRTERLESDGAGDLRLPVWTPSGMAMAMGMEANAQIARRPDKRFSIYIFWSMVVGATRLEEAKVIEIKCA
jgi:hypothetical protein